MSLNFLFVCVAGSADSALVCPEAGVADPANRGKCPDRSDSGETRNTSSRNCTVFYLTDLICTCRHIFGHLEHMLWVTTPNAKHLSSSVTEFSLRSHHIQYIGSILIIFKLFFGMNGGDLKYNPKSLWEADFVIGW